MRRYSFQGADLFARGDAKRRPSVDGLVPRMLAAIDRRGWVSAAALCAELKTDKRSLREAANRSGGRILGHQRGYILTLQAPLEDVQRVEARLLSQSTQMKNRVVEIRRVRYGTAADFGGAA